METRFLEPQEPGAGYSGLSVLSVLADEIRVREYGYFESLDNSH